MIYEYAQSSLTRAAITATCASIKAPTHLIRSTLSSSKSVLVTFFKLSISQCKSSLVANSPCDFFSTATTVSDCLRVNPFVSSSLTNSCIVFQKLNFHSSCCKIIQITSLEGMVSVSIEVIYLKIYMSKVMVAMCLSPR